MQPDYQEFMKIALEEAKISLKEGNHGFGAVIVKNNELLVRAHDQEETESDPTSHAEINAIRFASRKYGRDFENCILISTHEPCPMCATAIVWSGIKTLVYGYSITEAIAEGRKRIDLTCRELFERAQAGIEIHSGVLHKRCEVLYRKDVRVEIKRLRSATMEDLELLREQLLAKRIEWYGKNPQFNINQQDLLSCGYELMLRKLEIQSSEAPIVEKNTNKVVFHSQNFCPTLEACKILDLDTRMICRIVNEKPMDGLIKQISDQLEFGRNYEKMRPYCDYCEEMIFLTKEQN